MGPHQDTNDRLLVELASLASAGDTHAAQRLFRLLIPRVRNLVRYVVRGDRDVEDLTQDALVVVFRGLGSYRQDGRFQAWTDRVVVRATLRAAEKRRLHEAPLNDVDSSECADTVGSGSEAYLWRRRLIACLDRLPWMQRQAVVLHFVLDFTVPEVAEELGVPVETVRSRLRLGMRKLKDDFARDAERQVG